MKRVIFSTVLLFSLTTWATAQTATGNTSTTTSAASSTAPKKKSQKKKSSEVLNNRRIYHFRNGQRSTPTGNEATPVGGGYASLGGERQASAAKGDTVNIKPKTTTRSKAVATTKKKRNQ